MINMFGTAAAGGPRKRPGGGSMTTQCDQISIGFFWQQLVLSRLPQNGILPGNGIDFEIISSDPFYWKLAYQCGFVNEPSMLYRIMFIARGSFNSEQA
jgi:hypothetical protein